MALSSIRGSTMKWAYIQIFFYAILMGIVVTIEVVFAALTDKLGIPLTIFIVFLSITILAFFMDLIRNKTNPKILEVLRGILNSCALQKLDFTSIRDFLKESKEGDLKRGDTVKVLTNSLENYDNTPSAINLIANNLVVGVNYIYYLPIREYEGILDQKDEFVNSLLKEREDISLKDLETNLRFHYINEKCLYNFAVVTSSGHNIGYWYVTRKSQDESESNLAILTLNKDNTEKLIKVFTRLSSFKKATILNKQ